MDRRALCTLLLYVTYHVSCVSAATSGGRDRRHIARGSSEHLSVLLRDTGLSEAESEWIAELEEEAGRPGFVGRITQKGFDFAASMAINILMKELKNLTIPDLNTKIGIADVTVSGVRVDRFPRPNSELHPVPWPGYGMRWEASGLSPVIVADYTADFDLGLWTITKSGKATFKGKDLHFKLDFFMGRDEDGRPTTEILTCDCDGAVDLDFRGAWSDILNVGSDLFDDRIRALIAAQICFQAKKEINSKLGTELRKIPLTLVVEDDYLIDFSLVQAPVIYSDAVEIPLKGGVYLATDPQEPPFTPPLLSPRHQDNDKMVYVSLTDYIVNSGLHAVFLNDKLRYSVTADLIPEEFRGYMNTTCPLSLCLGTIFRQLPSLFPDATAAVEVRAIEAPHVDVLGSDFNVSAVGAAEVYVEINETRHSLFVIGLNATGSFNVKLTGKTVSLGVSGIEVTSTSVDVLDSSIGDIGSGFFFESILRVITQEVVIPKIREFGEKGVEIPKVKGVEFVDPIIAESETPGVIVLGTDISYATKKRRNFGKRRWNKRKGLRRAASH